MKHKRNNLLMLPKGAYLALAPQSHNFPVLFTYLNTLGNTFICSKTVFLKIVKKNKTFEKTNKTNMWGQNLNNSQSYRNFNSINPDGFYAGNNCVGGHVLPPALASLMPQTNVPVEHTPTNSPDQYSPPTQYSSPLNSPTQYSTSANCEMQNNAFFQNSYVAALDVFQGIINVSFFLKFRKLY